jgi:flagellar FliL protein
MAKEKAKAKENPKADEDAATDGTEAAAAAPKKKLSLKTLLLFVVAPLVVVIGLGAGAYLFLFSGGGEEHADAAHGEGGEHGHAAPSAGVFYDLPEILVNIASTGPKPIYLKLGVSLELDGPETTHAIEPVLPRVLDNFQVYLRELRLEDLQGSAGLLRLKEELIRRVNLAVAPIVVKDVLFKDMIIQ